ncbi:hypothetical protein ABPG72_003934 [Tetrahymena utriculariae]
MQITSNNRKVVFYTLGERILLVVQQIKKKIKERLFLLKQKSTKNLRVFQQEDFLELQYLRAINYTLGEKQKMEGMGTKQIKILFQHLKKQLIYRTFRKFLVETGTAQLQIVKTKQIILKNKLSSIFIYTFQLYVTGHNKYGSCGLSGIDEINRFQLNDTIKDIQICSISAGDGFSLYLDINKQVHSSGFRQMHGNKEDQHQHEIKKIKQLEGISIKHINAGFCHAAVVTQEGGEVYTWGSGNFYQLGHGNTKSQKTPVKINNLSGIEQVSCSRGEKYCHTTATSSDGKVYSWGSGYKGKLGHQNSWSHEDPADESRPKPIQYLQEKGIVIAKSISGGIHSAVLSQDGRLFTFGCGSDGRLGHIEAEKYVYLYREPFPREIQGPFLNNKIIDACSSYYFMAAIAES